MFITKFFQLCGMFKFFHNKMLGGKEGRAQNVKSCSKNRRPLKRGSVNNVMVKGLKKKKNGSQLNSIGHRVKLQVPPIGVEG